MHPLVTIAIPTFNRATGTLRDAIRAALNQSYRHLEILVADNCSSDETEEVVRCFDDPRVRYHRHQKNIGHNNNFNFCLQEARGAYFMILPDDDLIDPEFVETCLERCEYRTDIAMVLTGARTIDDLGMVRSESVNPLSGRSVADLARSWFVGRKPLYLCSTLFVTAKLREFGGFGSKHNLYQDTMAEFALAARHGWIDVEEIKASIRKHAGEITYSARITNSCEDALILLELVCNLVAPAEVAEIRKAGMKYLARGNYNRARRVNRSRQRLLAYLTVFRMFGYRHIPPTYHLSSPGFGIRRRVELLFKKDQPVLLREGGGAKKARGKPLA